MAQQSKKDIYEKIEDKLEDGVADLYKRKCKFHKSRYTQLNTNHIVCARLIKALVLIVAFLFWAISMGLQIVQGFNPLDVQIYYYSLWGLLISIIAMVMSIVAVYRENWYRSAFIWTEISYGVNLVILILFWGILWPQVTAMMEIAKKGDPTADPPVLPLDQNVVDFFLLYQSTIHIIPFVMTAINIAITDMNLHLPHWWIVSAVFCPAYAFFNYIGGYQLGEQLGHIGSVYGIEDWDKNFGLTLIAAIVVGLAQGGLFALSCKVIEWFRPEEASDESNQVWDQNQTDQESEKNRINSVQ